MATCRVIVLEKTGRWSAALRAIGQKGLPPVVQARTLSELRDWLRKSPGSLVALEATAANFSAVSSLIGDLQTRFPNAAIAVLVDAQTQRAENLLREAGVHDVISSVLEIQRLARMACRLAAQSPPPDVVLPEFINQTLPWPALATRQWIEGSG